MSSQCVAHSLTKNTSATHCDDTLTYQKHPVACLSCLQWMMINRLLRIMWPKLTESIFKTVIGVVKPMIQDMLNKVGICCSNLLC